MHSDNITAKSGFFPDIEINPSNTDDDNPAAPIATERMLPSPLPLHNNAMGFVITDRTIELEKINELKLLNGESQCLASTVEKNLYAQFSLQGMRPFEAFWRFTELTNNKAFANLTTGKIKKLEKLIKLNIDMGSHSGKDFISITVKVDSKHKSDDEIYQNNPVLVEILPRSMTLVFDGHSKQFIHAVQGPCKFSGKNSKYDEDTKENQVIPSVYDHDKVVQWVENKCCSITTCDKANGKLAILKARSYNDRILLTAGSKNKHITTYLDDIGNVIKNPPTDIVGKIFSDIDRNRGPLNQLLPIFEQGFSLVGELEDGQHFTPGDNTVSWFGLFKQGHPEKTIDTLSMLQNIGLKTVSFCESFRVGDSAEKLDQVFDAQKFKKNEGSVLYITNTETGETQLVKSKSIQYVVKRFAREKFKGGWKNISAIKKRFIDAADYHQLSTDAAIRVTKQLFNFGLWMMRNEYPCNALDNRPINSVRGAMGNGFNHFWLQYLQQTGAPEIEIKPEDIGEFNAAEYSTSPLLKLYNERKSGQEPLVVFFQGIQGAGKSTLAHQLCALSSNSQIIEQDRHWGDTQATQGALYHAIRDACGPDTIFISRCNANRTHYRHYLNLVQGLNCRVMFIGSSHATSHLGLAIALAGILNRSDNGDSLMVGRVEHSIDKAIDITTRTWQDFKYHHESLTFDTFHYDKDLANEATQAFKQRRMKGFVLENKETLMSLRMPLETVAGVIHQSIFANRIYESPGQGLVSPSLDEVSYISLSVDDKQTLLEIVKAHCKSVGTEYCDHLTVNFFSENKKRKKSKKSGASRQEAHDILPQGSKCQVVLDALVINTATGSAAFRAQEVRDMNSGQAVKVSSEKPHITAFVAAGGKPKDSADFVMLTDDSVRIIPMKNPLNIATTCKWNY